MVSEETYGGVGHKKALLHANKWNVYLNEIVKQIKGG